MEKMFIVSESSVVAEVYEGLLGSFFEKSPSKSAELLGEKGPEVEELHDMMDLADLMFDKYGHAFTTILAAVMPEEVLKAAEKLYTQEALDELSVLDLCEGMEEINNVAYEIGDFPLS